MSEDCISQEHARSKRDIDSLISDFLEKVFFLHFYFYLCPFRKLFTNINPPIFPVTHFLLAYHLAAALSQIIAQESFYCKLLSLSLQDMHW